MVGCHQARLPRLFGIYIDGRRPLGGRLGGQVGHLNLLPVGGLALPAAGLHGSHEGG